MAHFVFIFFLLTLFPWIVLGIRPKLGAEDRLALLGFEDYRPEKYSNFIKHSVLTKFGFNPLDVRVETSIPLFIVSAEDPTSTTLPPLSLVFFLSISLR